MNNSKGKQKLKGFLKKRNSPLQAGKRNQTTKSVRIKIKNVLRDKIKSKEIQQVTVSLRKICSPVISWRHFVKMDKALDPVAINPLRINGMVCQTHIIPDFVKQALVFRLDTFAPFE